MNLSLYGVVLVGAHAWVRNLQDYSHTPSDPGHASLECDLWDCSLYLKGHKPSATNQKSNQGTSVGEDRLAFGSLNLWK
jgi:hypothetical protein